VRQLRGHRVLRRPTKLRDHRISQQTRGAAARIPGPPHSILIESGEVKQQLLDEPAHAPRVIASIMRRVLLE